MYSELSIYLGIHAAAFYIFIRSSRVLLFFLITAIALLSQFPFGAVSSTTGLCCARPARLRMTHNVSCISSLILRILTCNGAVNVHLPERTSRYVFGDRFCNVDMLETLPEDVIYKILDLTDSTTRANLILVNKFYNSLASVNWRALDLTSHRDVSHAVECLDYVADKNSQSMSSVTIKACLESGSDLPGTSANMLANTRLPLFNQHWVSITTCIKWQIYLSYRHSHSISLKSSFWISHRGLLHLQCLEEVRNVWSVIPDISDSRDTCARTKTQGQYLGHHIHHRIFCSHISTFYTSGIVQRES